MLKNHLTLTPMTATEKLTAWFELLRLDKPIGTELLLYPTLWSLFLASAQLASLPGWSLVLVFALGAFLMRAAGCAINDFADRKVDGRVKRTKGRPLADGRLSAKTAALTFVGLSLISAGLLVFLPIQVFYHALIAVVLAFIYPFMKRYTHLPQVVLAAAFGWAVPMAFVAVQGEVGLFGWLTFIAYMCWTVAYDTQYAMCDRDDDLKIGVKSTAILFGRYDLLIIVILQALFVLIMGFLLYRLLVPVSVFLLVPVVGLFVYQAYLTKDRERLACFAAFRHNAWVGRYLVVVVLISCLMVY